MQTRRVVANEIHGVMVDAAAHEDKVVANPVRNAKAQNLLIEFCDLLDVLYARRDMSEFERADAAFGRDDGVNPHSANISTSVPFGSRKTSAFLTAGVRSERSS